jgi:hypothetical protein
MLGDGRLRLLAALGSKASRAAVGGDDIHWSLQHQHPGDELWLEVGHFGSEELAQIALDALVAHDHGDKEDFRIKRVVIQHRP